MSISSYTHIKQEMANIKQQKCKFYCKKDPLRQGNAMKKICAMDTFTPKKASKLIKQLDLEKSTIIVGMLTYFFQKKACKQ